MRFAKAERQTPYVVTPLKLENHRRKVLTRLPWCLAAMPAFQPDLGQEAAKRMAESQAWHQDWRDKRAAAWMDARAAYYALGAEDRLAIKAQWTRWNGPLRGDLLAYLIRTHLQRRHGRGEDS